MGRVGAERRGGDENQRWKWARCNIHMLTCWLTGDEVAGSGSSGSFGKMCIYTHLRRCRCVCCAAVHRRRCRRRDHCLVVLAVAAAELQVLDNRAYEWRATECQAAQRNSRQWWRGSGVNGNMDTTQNKTIHEARNGEKTSQCNYASTNATR